MKRFPCFSPLLLTICAGGLLSASADVTVALEPAGRRSVLPVVTCGGEMCAALPQFFEHLGFSCRWDGAVRQLQCSRGGRQLVFTQDVPWYSAGDTVSVQLSAAPKRIGASLFLPLRLLLEMGRGAEGVKLGWDSASQVLTIHRNSGSIVAAACEKKQRGVLVSIDLTDSLPFGCVYGHPCVTLSFPGAAIDTLLALRAERVGFVDSLQPVQRNDSALLRIFVSKEIEEPGIEYLQERRKLLVDLQPKKRTPAVRIAGSGPDGKKGTGINTIVIDPGHGGKDPGAMGATCVKEKDIALAIALQLRLLFARQAGIRVHLTRDRDEFIPLAERTRLANRLNADLFISVHCNAMPGSEKKKETTRGYKVYFLSQAKNEEDRLAAMRENAVIELEEKPQNYGALQNVLIGLAGDEFLRESQELSILLDGSFAGSLGRRIQRFPPGVGQANFWVLNGAYMPSVLIETGFISNRSEEKILSDQKFQKEMATAILETVLHFKKRYETEP